MKHIVNDNEQRHFANTSDAPRVLILGATGGFGTAITQQMAARGWQVRAITRKPHEHNDSSKQVDWIVGDLGQPDTLVDAAKNVDVIVHAVNVPYQHWNPTMLNYTRTIIELARDNNAHLMFVGNVYNAGIPANGVISEHTRNAPVNEKGDIRAQIETMIEAAASQGLRTTIMRFGDFFGPGVGNSNWFNVCTKSIGKNKLMFAADADMPHTWAYLPDAANAFEQVATLRLKDTESPNHLVLPFAGHVFSFGQLHSVFESALGQPVKVSKVPWTVFKALGWVVPFIRDLVSMRYLWQHDIRMDGRLLSHYLGTAPLHTPLQQAALNSVPELSDVRGVGSTKQTVKQTVTD